MPTRTRTRIRCLLAGWLLATAACAQQDATKAPDPKQVEARIKAEVLERIASGYLDWPAMAFADAKDPFRILVVGKSPLGMELELAFRRSRVAGRPVVVEHAPEPNDGALAPRLAGCQLLVVGTMPRAQEEAVRARVASKPVLTVGERPGFVADGGAIQLFLSDGKTRFEINQGALSNAGITARAKLLSLSRPAPKPPDAAPPPAPAPQVEPAPAKDPGQPQDPRNGAAPKEKR